MSKFALIIGVSASILATTMASASAQNTPPPYVYYILPCDTPGAIPAAPAAPDPGASPGAVTCIAPVATSSAGAFRRAPRYQSAWPYWESVGVAYHRGHHRSFSHSPHRGHGGHGGHGRHGGGGHHGRH